MLVPPFGWEATTSGRSLRAWARELAAAGFPAVRFHAPGSGDSEGDGTAQDLETWTGALLDVVAHTRAAAGCGRVAVVGLGLGGLVAARAVAAGADVDDLVLWAAPAKGRLLLRELRAFAAMTLPLDQEPVTTSPVDDGVLWVHGYPLGQRAQEQLSSFDVADLDLGRLRRALVLGRGSLQPDAAVVAALEAAGVDVTSRPGEGYERLVADTRYSALTPALIGAVSSWLVPGEVVDAAPWPTADVPERHVVTGGASAVVHPVPGAALTAVFLGTVATPRCGPNRMWTDTARRWAAAGVASVRMELWGNGEADGPDTWPGALESFYGTSFREQIGGLLDAAVAQGLPPRFLLVGLSSGAYWAAQVGHADPRVEAVALLNVSAMVWPPPLTKLGVRGRLRDLALRSTWERLLHDPVRRRANLGSARRSVALRLSRLLRRSDENRGSRPPATSRQLLLALHGKGVRVTIGLSAGEPLAEELATARQDLPVRLVRFAGPAGAHTLAPPRLREQALRLLDEVLDEVRATRPGP